MKIPNWAKGKKMEEYILPWNQRASQVVLVVKTPPANSGDIRDTGSTPVWGRSSGEGMATHSSILAWRISQVEETGGLQSIVSQRVKHYWRDLACMHGIEAFSPLIDCTSYYWKEPWVGATECSAFFWQIWCALDNLHRLLFKGRKWIINLISQCFFWICIWKQMTDLHNETTTHTWILHYFLKKGMYWFVTVVAYKYMQLFLSCFLHWMWLLPIYKLARNSCLCKGKIYNSLLMYPTNRIE